MRFRLPALLALSCFTACSTSTVRLYELREAESGSAAQASYQRLETAVDYANQFLSQGAPARGFPAENARFSLGMTDILVTYQNEGVEAIRLESAGWGDLRTVLGDQLHPTEQGFLSATAAGSSATGDKLEDVAFLQLPATEMAALLLQQAAMLREMKSRGEFDYWMNYDALGLGSGWADNNPVDRRAIAIADAFLKWIESN